MSSMGPPQGEAGATNTLLTQVSGVVNPYSKKQRGVLVVEL